MNNGWCHQQDLSPNNPIYELPNIVGGREPIVSPLNSWMVFVEEGCENAHLGYAEALHKEIWMPWCCLPPSGMMLSSFQKCFTLKAQQNQTWETGKQMFYQKNNLQYAATDAMFSWKLYQVLKSLPDAKDATDHTSEKLDINIPDHHPYLVGPWSGKNWLHLGKLRRERQ
ncbi:hypothetical protein NC653_004880 [Populus alba x Populus x berolinensis]|uniref:Uncharacterized protein n=1 Tax=Populus alba x Populus x berolinensis TaxID=444605 RepID=A0AAD6RWS0_9ROSI|nr:hypothetical protein NC653_004880 [Populus alba x Populus x berolinensis]